MTGGLSVVDTNVILVAGNRHEDISGACVAACASRLAEIVAAGQIAIDDGYEILGEYLNKNDPKRGKDAGEVFVKWVIRNQTNPLKCVRVRLERDEAGEYASFPRHPELSNFDPPDKKFVAVSAAHPDHPPILEAADSKWLDWTPALKASGVKVDFICPRDLRRFHKKKFGG
jgi:hypothetical protein